MDHKKLQEKLSAFRDRELPLEECREISEHVKTCQDCLEILKRWESFGSVLSKTAVEPSESFVNKVMEDIAELEKSVEEPAPWATIFQRWLVPAAGYALAFLLMFGVLSYWQPLGNNETNTETVLLASVPQASQWIFAKEPAPINQLLEEL